MFEAIFSVIANIVTILSGVLSFFNSLRRYREFLVWIAVLSACFSLIIAIIIFKENRPVATVVTSFNYFEDGFYKGKQQHFYSFPLNYYHEPLHVLFNTRNNEGDKPAANYSVYAIYSSGEYSKLDPNVSRDFVLPKEINSQVVIDNDFKNTISVSKDNSSWDKPYGWAGFNYDTTKIYPTKEITFILDFRGIMIKKTNNYTKKDPPRFFIVNKIDPKPEEIKEQGDELMKNRFEVMKVLPDSDDLIWFISIKDPPRGKVLLRWKPD
ncbi:MAG: hypothetical protein WBO35_02955 [Candidatus Saccharimonadales bacterium]